MPRQKLRLVMIYRCDCKHFFAEAKQVTGDYETIFGDDPKDMGRRIPFYSDAAVQGWRSLIEQIHEFDFSKLDYEVVGSIFERLIGPEGTSQIRTVLHSCGSCGFDQQLLHSGR